MMSQTRKTIWLLAGGYLVYRGIMLLRVVLADRPEHSLIFAAFGLLFILFGGGLALWVVGTEIKQRREERQDPEGTGEQAEEDTEEKPGKIAEENTEEEPGKIAEENMEEEPGRLAEKDIEDGSGEIAKESAQDKLEEDLEEREEI